MLSTIHSRQESVSNVLILVVKHSLLLGAYFLLSAWFCAGLPLSVKGTVALYKQPHVSKNRIT